MTERMILGLSTGGFYMKGDGGEQSGLQQKHMIYIVNINLLFS